MISLCLCRLYPDTFIFLLEDVQVEVGLCSLFIYDLDARDI